MMHRGRPVFHAPPTAASILALLAGIEKRTPLDPAITSFRMALARQGREAYASGGRRALDDLQREIATSDPERADTRIAILQAAWIDLLPRPGGSARE